MPTIKDVSGTVLPEVASAIGNPTSTLSLTSSTTAYSAAQLVANNATAGSVTVPSFALPSNNVDALIPRLRLSINDSTSTAWGSVGVQIDLWSAAPTFSNGDRGTFAIATGSASHLGAYTGVFSAVGGDGVYCELAPAVGNAPAPALAGSTIYWTLQTTSATGTTGASKTVSLTVETVE